MGWLLSGGWVPESVLDGTLIRLRRPFGCDFVMGGPSIKYDWLPQIGDTLVQS